MLCLCRACTCLLSSQFDWTSPLLVLPLLLNLLCQVVFVNGNPSGSGWEIRSRKPLWKSGSSSAVNLLTDRTLSTDHSDCIPGTTRISKQRDSLPCEPTKPQDKAYFWERLEAPLPPLRPRPKCNFTHPRQLSPFPERL